MNGGDMSAFLYRLGRGCARHPFRVFGAWLALAAAVMVLSGTVGGDYHNTFRIPGADSQRAADVLKDRFPSRSGVSSRFVFHTTSGRLDDNANRAVVGAAVQRLAGDHDVVDVTDPFAPGSGAISADGRTAYADVSYGVDKVDATHLADARAVVDAAQASGVQTEFNGNLAFVDQDAPSSELIGLVVAVLVLLFAFGSVIAMGLPIGTALIGIVVGLAGVGVVAGVIDVPTVTQTVGVMIGLGVGIDYALFIVTRHRQHLHEGMAVADAAGVANATSGRAVLFAGTTVVIAILGLVVAGLPMVTAMGLAVAVIVIVAMLAAVTLLPALLGVAGTKIDRLSIHRRGHGSAQPERATWAGRWAHRVGTRPGRYAAASLATLCVLAVPVLSMRIGIADDGNAATSHTERRAYDLLSDGFGRGFNGPMMVVVDLPDPSDRTAVDRVADALANVLGIAKVDAPVTNGAGDTVLVRADPTTSPQDQATDALVHHLRDDVLPDAVAGTNARAMLTGQATTTDISSRITNRLPWFIAAVVGVSFVLLMLAFRSVLVPLKAALMNLLSIAAAYGVVVAVFQWGWGKGLIGLDHTVPVNPFAPLMMFAILFGLSMDYEVFLLSRVRESYLESGDSHRSVVQGLSSTARVITSAALIMISVFGAFILTPDTTVKMFGLGLSVAVFFDATLVRMVLVPATMSLLGSANWWLPGWLDRLLPHLDVDGGPGSSWQPDDTDTDRELVAA
jgi:RND superfamily putative drug exporter